ncbi:MAG TPA: FecR domain-containing protein [Caulobacteraceae bacterium]|jgi:transmembrane sensor
MSQADPAHRQAAQEASAWFARLKRRQVSLTDLEAFRAWRAEPHNRAAYERVDATWREAGALAGDAASRQAVSDALRRGAARHSRRDRRAAWIAGAGVAATVLILVAGGAALYQTAHPTYATAVGEQRLVRLADGSTVRLDTDSKLQVSFSSGARDIQLDHGQAFFDVAHDASRPFLVQAGPVTVRAVGTQFDVRADGAAPLVTLVQGVIEVKRRDGTAQTWTLHAGQQLITSPASVPKTTDVAAATSWTSGRVVFEGAPLGDAIAEINRYCAHKIVLRAPRLGATPVSGSFESGDAAAFVAAESDLHGLRATTLPDGTIVLDAVSATPD